MIPLEASLCILLCMTISNVLASDPPFTCEDVVESAHPPVVNSSVYSYKATISVISKNLTVDAYETYDMDRGIINMVVHFPENDSDASPWKTEWIQYDYNHNQSLTIDMDSKKCDVDDLVDREPVSIFGLGVENGFKDIKFPFYWTGDYNYTLENGTYLVNGVPGDKYSTCLLFNNSHIKYEVFLVFSVDEWNNKAGSNVPLKLVLKVNRTEDGSTFDFDEYVYTFTSYRHDNKGGWNPGSRNPLWNVKCEGRKDAIPLPKAPSNYAQTEEMHDPQKKMIHSARKHFNFDEKMARADFVAPKNLSRWPAPNHHFTLIQDFKAGVQYWMDRESGNCTIQNLTLENMKVLWDGHVENEHLMMLSHARYMEERNFTYTGRHHMRNMTIDSWTSTVPARWNNSKGGQVSADETVLYTAPDWTNGETSPVLIGEMYHMVTTNGPNTTVRDIMLHISGYSTQFHSNHLFDVSPCYGSDEKVHIVLKFPGNYGQYIEQHSGLMTAAIRKSVAEAAKVRQLRVASWSAMDTAADNGNADADNSLFVSTSITDHPTIHGDTGEYEPSINLTTAMENLRRNVTQNLFYVAFTLPSGDEVRMTAYSDYFKERKSLYSPAAPAPAPAPASSAVFSKGAVAAISIGMIVLGFILGAVFSHCRNKRGNRQFGYSIQD